MLDRSTAMIGTYTVASSSPRRASTRISNPGSPLHFPLSYSLVNVGRSRTTAVNTKTTVNRTVTSNLRSITIETFGRFS
ncbi:hypothetical protein ES703_05505 [subsurface metagenome]